MRQVLSWLKNRYQRHDYQQKRSGPDVTASFYGRTVKVLILGAQGVSKTSLVRKIVGGVDVGKKPTVYDVYEKEFKEVYGTVQVELTDMTGEFAFPAMEKMAIKRSDVFVLVYSVDKQETIREVERLRKIITNTKSKHSTEIPIIVVGNKLDLLNSSAEFDSNTENTIKDWCFSHLRTSAQREIKLYALERALIQECTFYAVTTKIL